VDNEADIEVRFAFWRIGVPLISFQTLKQNLNLADQERYLTKLPYADGAAFDSYDNQHDPQCLKGTRVDLLKQITAWGENPGGKNIFWLKGMAGTGKSTIARTVAGDFTKNGCLVASFFFSRGSGERGRAVRFFTTLASQLANISSHLKSYICHAIAEHGDIAKQSLAEQWKWLIFQPLSKLGNDSPQPPTFFVIDALDECESQEDVRMIIQLLAQAKNLNAIQVRIFITNRPEISIRDEFGAIPESIHQDFVLHDISNSIVEGDISTYIRDELDKVKRKCNLPSDWPNEHNIKLLVQRADCLFIYAATACRFIGDRNFSPNEQLDLVLQGGVDSQSSTLDKMYSQVLQQSVNGDYNKQKKDELSNRFRQVVGSIVILLNPLSAVTLSNLLSVPKEKTDITLRSLYSVLDVSQDETSPIRLLHLSFCDFLLDKERCSDTQFWVYEKKAQSSLVESCLQVMSSALRRDICNLQEPGCLASEIERDSVDKCLPVHIQYACRYWVDHFMRSDIEFCDNGQVHKFIQKHFLHWLEALSLMGKISEGILMITALQSKPAVSFYAIAL
jgi:hypothetical protein